MHPSITCGLVVLVAGTCALAHGGDIGLRVLNGRIVTGHIQSSGGSETVVPGVRVFAGELDEGSGFGDEPGMFNDDGSFPGGSGLGFDVLKALRIWDDLSQNFDAIAAESLEIVKGPLSITTPAIDVLTPGFSFLLPGGSFDEHFDYQLSPGFHPGVYLLELRFWSTDAGVGVSDPLWIVLNAGGESMEAQHDRALDWAKANLPSPSAALTLVLGAVLSSRRRRS